MKNAWQRIILQDYNVDIKKIEFIYFFFRDF